MGEIANLTFFLKNLDKNKVGMIVKKLMKIGIVYTGEYTFGEDLKTKKCSIEEALEDTSEYGSIEFLFKKSKKDEGFPFWLSFNIHQTKKISVNFHERFIYPTEVYKDSEEDKNIQYLIDISKIIYTITNGLGVLYHPLDSRLNDFVFMKEFENGRLKTLCSFMVIPPNLISKKERIQLLSIKTFYRKEIMKDGGLLILITKNPLYDSDKEKPNEIAILEAEKILGWPSARKNYFFKEDDENDS